jgi:hypothetical protein
MRRYAHALRRIVTSLVEERLARRHKKGTYLIKRAVEAVVAVMTTDAILGLLPPIFKPPQMLGLLSTAVSAGAMHPRQMSIRGGADGGRL